MKYLFVLLLLLLGAEVYFYIDFLNYSYEARINAVMNKFSTSYLIEKFPVLFTKQRYTLLTLLIPILLFIQGIGIALVYRSSATILTTTKLIVGELNEIKIKVFLLLKALSPFQRILLGSISLGILVSRIYLIDKYPFSGDEAQSYFTFVQNGFLLTCTFYPEPNNHIFYNILMMGADKVISDPILVMRVPNILINLLLLSIGFLYLLGKKNYTTAILFLILAGFAFSTSIYAVQGRGYMLVNLFTVISALAAIKLTKNTDSKLAFWSLTTASILAIYTIPIFLFNFVGLAAYLTFFFFQKKQYLNIYLVLKYCLIVTIGWIALYLPVFLISGLDSVFNNELIMKYELHYFFTFIIPVASIEAINFMLGTYAKGYYLFLLLIAFIFYTSKKSKDSFLKNFTLLSSINITAFMLIMIVRRVFGEARVFNMYSFLFVFLLALTLSFWIDKIRKPIVYKSILMSLALFFILLIPLTFEKKMNSFYGNNYFQHFQNITDDVTLIVKENPQNIYVSSKGQLLYLKLYNAQHQTNINLCTPNSLRNLPFDFIIVNEPSELPPAIDIQQYNLLKGHTKALVYKKK